MADGRTAQTHRTLLPVYAEVTSLGDDVIDKRAVMHFRRLVVCAASNVLLVAVNIVLWSHQPAGRRYKPGQFSQYVGHVAERVVGFVLSQLAAKIPGVGVS